MRRSRGVPWCAFLIGCDGELGYLPDNPYGDFWDCPPIITREEGEPAPQVLQSLDDFGATWSGAFSLALEGSDDLQEVPAEVRFDLTTVEAAGQVTPDGAACAGSVAVLFVRAELQILDWVGDATSEVLVVSRERAGWHGGDAPWEHDVWVHGGVFADALRGEPEAALYAALTGLEAPAEMAEVIGGAYQLRGGASSVAFDVGEADMPSRLLGTSHLEPVRGE